MNIRALIFSGFAACMLTLPGSLVAARITADLQPPQKRQTTVANAERLARRKAPPPLPADLISPFNPPDFNKPEAPEGAPAPAPSTATVLPVAPVVPDGPRETLEKLAAQIKPSGVMMRAGVPRLLIGGKSFEVGTRFTATYNNQDYELELVAIDRTTFTLRYRGEETTRPIKPVR